MAIIIPGTGATAAGITTQKITNWDTAYGWGDHATANYLALAGGTMAGNLNLPSLNGGQLAGMRNKIINGKMDIAQRGTSFAAIASGAYSLDRWAWLQNATTVVTVSQQQDVPSSNEFLNSLRVAVTTAQTSFSSTSTAYIQQKIEGYNVRDLIGKTFTVSFWVRSSKTGIHCFVLRNSGADRSYVAEYTVNSANTWEYKSVTVSGGLITAGTWNWTNGIGLQLRFVLATGTSLQTTPGSWQTGAYDSTANQVNCLDTVDNIFAITGVQLEVGSVATPFEHRPYGAELALCYRYYEQASGVGYICESPYGTGVNPRASWFFKVQKRATPTVVNQGTGALGTIYIQRPETAGVFAALGGSASFGSTSYASAEL